MSSPRAAAEQTLNPAQWDQGDARQRQRQIFDRPQGDEEDDISTMYQMLENFGKGRDGYMVYKAVCRQSKSKVAIKKIPIVHEDDGVPIIALREISLLRECDHPNVIRLYDVHSNRVSLHLVFECLDMDLRVFLKRYGAMHNTQLMGAAAQCFAGIEYCHGHRILHRDLWPRNVRMDVRSTPMRFVLAEFGLARWFSTPLKAYTHEVVTLWYRSVEVLLGQAKYGTSMDIWSLGCILAEMATGQALFPGDSEIGTLFKIFKTLGTPNEEVWPGVSTLKDFKGRFPRWPSNGLADVRRASNGSLGDDGIDLLSSCLSYNHVNRPSAKRALRHAFFEGPVGSPPAPRVATTEPVADCISLSEVGQ